MSKKIHDYWVAGGVALLTILIGVVPHRIEAANWAINDWQINVTIQKNGACRFQETRTYQFAGPVTTLALQWPVLVNSTIQNFSITDDAGATIIHDARPAADTNGGLRYTLNVSPAPGSHGWRAEYDVAGCVSYFDNYDQLHWTIATDSRVEEIHHLKIRVRLPRPAELLDRFSQSLMIGTAAGPRELGGAQVLDGQTIEFDGSALPAKSSVSFLASWPKDVLDEPGTLKVMAKGNHDETLMSRLTLGGQATGLTTPHVFHLSDAALEREVISLAVEHFGYRPSQQILTIVRGKSDVYTFSMQPTWWYQPMRVGLAVVILLAWVLPWWAWYHWYGRWRRLGRDPKAIQLSKPALGPGQLTPSQLGVIIDERVDRRDLAVAVLFLAVHKFIAIRWSEASSQPSRREYQLVKLDKNHQILGPFEQKLLTLIFAKESNVTLSDLASRHATLTKNITVALYDDVASQGYFSESPASVRHRYQRWPMRWLVASVIITLAALVWYPAGFVAVLPPLIVAIMAVLFAGIMPKKTLKGTEVAHWSQQYVRQLFDDQPTVTQPIPQWELERILPYLLVLEADAIWLDRHAQVMTAWPEWLQPKRLIENFTVAGFMQVYNEFITLTEATFKK